MIKKKSKHQKKVEQYVDDVLGGHLTVGILELRAVERYVRDLKQAKKRGWVFDQDAAEWAIEWFLHIKHTQGEYAGDPFDLYPIQAFIVWNIFGWKIKETGLRRFTDAFLSFGRGNGKTPLGVGLVTLATGFDILPDGKILKRANGYIAATKKDQAGIGFGDLKGYIDFVDENDEPSELAELCEVYQYHVEFTESDSRIEPISSDARVSDGFRIQGLLKDEIHAWTHHYQEFDAKLDTALGKFPQPLSITITTAGNERSVIWKAKRKLCGMVLDVDDDVEVDELFVMVCEIDEDDDPLDEETWPKANPLLRHGVVKINHLRKMAREAAISSEKLLQFERFHTNREVASSAKPIKPKTWALGNVELPPHEGQPAYAGIDLGWKRDICGVAYVWPMGDVTIDGEQKPVFRVECDAYIPKGCNRNLNAEPWKSWIASGLVTVTDSEWTDTGPIYRDLKRHVEEHGIASLAYDPNNAREFAVNAVNDLGIETFPFQQTCKKFNEPVQAFVQAAGEGRIIHGGNSILAWCAQNLMLKHDAAGHAMPDKEFSEEKIDLVVALIMAISEAMFADPPQKSVYETRGPLVFDEFIEDEY